MCKDCDCGTKKTHSHETKDTDSHSHKHKILKKIEKNVTDENDRLAHENRHWFEHHGLTVFNLISSPGSGKTALLEKTIELLKEKKQVAILVGDQETDHDAQRLLNRGGNVKQINTYSSCHLDAGMIAKELGGFVSGKEDILIIENIGNLVCPAAFDLGEDEKVALLSVTEGEDKPVKYPVLFHNSSVVLITKSDLIPHLPNWNLEKAKTYIRQVNPKAKIICTSIVTGEGLEDWIQYLQNTPKKHHH